MRREKSHYLQCIEVGQEIVEVEMKMYLLNYYMCVLCVFLAQLYENGKLAFSLNITMFLIKGTGARYKTIYVMYISKSLLSMNCHCQLFNLVPNLFHGHYHN